MPELKTVLHGLHAELGARFCPFAGFEMPLQYRDGLRAEHLHTRAHAGLFDVSHMGQVRVTGPDLHATLERALPVDFDGWPVGAQRYSLLLNERGGIEDDLMVTRLSDEVRIVVNAAGRQKDLALLRALCPQLSFELLDRALIALQGPEAEAVFADRARGHAPRVHAGRRVRRSARLALGLHRRGRLRDLHPQRAGSAARAQASFQLKGKTRRPRRARHAAPRSRAASLWTGHGRRHYRRWKRASAGRLPVAPRRRQERKAASRVPTSTCARRARARIAGSWASSATNRCRSATAPHSSIPKNKEVGIVTSGTVSPSTQRAIMLGYVSSTSENLFAVVRGADGRCASPSCPSCRSATRSKLRVGGRPFLLA